MRSCYKECLRMEHINMCILETACLDIDTYGGIKVTHFNYFGQMFDL